MAWKLETWQIVLYMFGKFEKNSRLKISGSLKQTLIFFCRLKRGRKNSKNKNSKVLNIVLRNSKV